MKDERSRWTVVEDDNFVHIVPIYDSKPHGKIINKTSSKTNVELATSDCPCNPIVEMGDEKGLWKKVMIRHNCFKDEERIALSVAQICG